MSGGLFALLDDVAALARTAAASVDDVAAAAGHASVKAAGVVVDDTAVTPQYVRGIAAHRELAVVRRIAVGSLRNKLLIILPVAMVLSQLLPWLLTPILMLGGTYLSFEGAEKVWERIRGHVPQESVLDGEHPDTEHRLVAGAVRTDLILSAEIMVIALNSVTRQGFVARATILVVVALVITGLVYGVVALIVRMDDAGLALVGRESPRTQRLGRGLVAAMPRVLALIGFVGTIAMLWVGGHILLAGADELGWHAPAALVHHLEHAVPPSAGVLPWLVGTACSAVAGLLVGAVAVGLWHLRFAEHDSAEAGPVRRNG